MSILVLLLLLALFGVIPLPLVAIMFFSLFLGVGAFVAVPSGF